ncbi:MAG TPA: oxidoreductase [Stackebrandtia sp.]|uniref:oxidoreductase n=1 Tax=Stackebrandtia sp. TaxID=2023065 RepID=UPI002D3E5C65|nr:oxidoreductase [Stackebrandtia sp.]HZE39062.1 oxidoreductase [Stackebrandtia sp.]
MSWFRRKKRSGASERDARRYDTSHLEEFHANHHGVEAYVEPRTTVTETTVMFIAHDGEWTRRRVDGVEAAFRLGERLGIPVYEVAKVGYPQRMRDYNARQRLARKRAAG